jgi:hypothetical protein
VVVSSGMSAAPGALDKHAPVHGRFEKPPAVVLRVDLDQLSGGGSAQPVTRHP